jgi:hypothetical protein
MSITRITIIALASALLAAAPGQTEQAAPPAQATTPDLRTAMPVTARQEGVWRGTFRRIDAEGKVIETFPTEITIRFPTSGPFQYEQTNIYRPEGKPEVVIPTKGNFDGERIVFENQRVRGWAMDDKGDRNNRTTLLFIENLDGTGSYMYETIHVSDDGNRRARVAQFFDAKGALQRRTLVDETRSQP